MQKFIFLALGLLILFLFQNCSQNVDFKTQNETEQSSTIPDGGSGNGNGPGPGNDGSIPGADYTEQFKVAFSSEAAPLDMIWVIDNSGSMTEEAALVRANFQAFLTELNKSTNFRLLLLSLMNYLDLGFGNGVSIPSGFDPNTHYQIDKTVGSRNGPQLLLENLSGAPAGFLRSNSKKIIVFVTDDDSDMSASQLVSSLTTQQGWSAADISVTSFIGLSAALSPCMAREGQVYKDLAFQTGGQTYNICTPDWSSYFSSLTNSSVSKAVRRFTLNLAGTVKEIVEVKVDGAAIDQTLYSLSGKTLTLADSVSLGQNSVVVVRYK